MRRVIVEFTDMRTLEGRCDSAAWPALIALRKQGTSDLDLPFMLEGA